MEELIKKAQSGDKEAFTEIILNLEDNLYKIARLRLSNEEDINDVIQETMISAFKSIRKLKHLENFKTWLIRILINKCNDMYRKNKNINISLEELYLDKQLKSDENDINNLNFYSIISMLNYDERLAITLYYMEMYTTKEIGHILHTKENTIKARISRAKAKIRKSYERFYYL